jgi:ABC-type histidine transport system ATPase subunit
MTEAVLHIKDLIKRYGDVEVLHHLNLEVTRGAMMADEREILRSADLCVNCAVELMEWLEPTPGPKPKTTRG